MIAYEDILDSSGMEPFREERRQRYYRKALAFCRTEFPGRFYDVSDANGLAFVQTAYRAGGSIGLRSERDHLKFLIAAVHWGADFGTDPRLGHRLAACGWLNAAGRAHIYLPLPPLLRAVDHWHAEVRPEGPDWLAAIKAADASAGLTGAQALQVADAIWPAGTRQMPQTSWPALAAIVDADRGRRMLDGTALVLHTLLLLRFGHRYADDPTLAALGTALHTTNGRPDRTTTLRNAALAVPPLSQEGAWPRT
ncbi:hypothetical protein [Jannaschia pohangensis]|uniref:Uncharacterized protein n=1 Tax=Jannaschia pohangensis TaxID=390807 RepID=A0A1I3IKI4_9RHOB|nr:hypothetical protein [Jannaschia pohangensis]SFI48508.1 hypothetical protein SAMN04488095_1012 [Jannaschia pohangensis]